MKHPSLVVATTFLLALVDGCGPVASPQATATSVPTATAAPVTPTPAPPEGLRIHKYPGNYTCFRLTTSAGITIITDPYNMDEDVQADIVTLSHEHADHADLSRITGEYALVNTVGGFSESGIDITGIGGHHNKGDGSTTNIIYVFDVDGVRLAQFASQGDMPTEDMFAQIGTVDVLIIQVYAGGGKLLPSEARDIVQRLQAKIVIPAHGDPNLTDDLAALLGGESEYVPAGELVVTRGDLSGLQTPRVVTLDVP
jgi:hypothetical protein